MKSLIVGLALVHALNAIAADEATYLPKDKPAPFAGYLLPPESAEKVREMKIDLATERKVNATHARELEISNLRIAKRDEHIDRLTANAAKNDGFWSNVGHFIMGAATATAMAFAVSKATK